MSAEKLKKITAPPRLGWQKEIAELVGCTRQTVARAIHENAKGEKAEQARQLYRAKYGNQ